MSKNLFTLSGRYIDLELLNSQHVKGLSKVVSAKVLWQNPLTFIPTPELVPTYIKLSKKHQSSGEELPFAILDKTSHNVLGSIKLQNLHDDYAEIGSTFIEPQHQKSAVNTEAKFILLKHAFEVLHLEHIDFIVHKENKASKRALKRLGIKENGSFLDLKHMPEWKDNEYLSFCIHQYEWERIKEKLENLLFS